MKHKVTIDALGRIAIPKSIRQKLHIQPKDVFEIETNGEELKLRPVFGKAKVRKERGVWVLSTGKRMMINKVIREVRDERDTANWHGDS